MHIFKYNTIYNILVLLKQRVAPTNKAWKIHLTT